MKATLIVGVAAVVAFGAGMYIGQQGESTVITDGSRNEAYGGGFRAEENFNAGQVAASFEGGEVRIVNDGESIQDAVNAASPGDTIRIMPGTYSETVYIDKDGIRLIGVIEEGNWATMDGERRLNDAVLYSGNNIVVENLKIIHYKGNAIMGQAGNNFEIRNNLIVDTGVYGIFPQLGQNGIVEGNVISGIEDAAIYVGMSDNIHVFNNEVFDSVAGIEIENSRHAIVENNYVHDNTGGILAFITPGLPIKTTRDVIIRHNFVVNNNTANFGAPGSTVSGIPAGTGVLIMAADEVVIEDNIITGNKTAGVLVVDHDNASNVTMDPESDPVPDRVAILDNFMMNNGYDTIDELKALMLTELKTGNPDIARAGTVRDGCINNRHRYTVVGLGDFADCDFDNTDNIDTYLLPEPVAAREIDQSEQGKITYLGICTGCHTYTGRMIGPPVQVIQAMYMDNPEGLAEYIAHPVKKREDYPEMPPQDYLSDEVRLAVAEYMLAVTN
ncbi:MAG: parallel beta-helix domain-containing protein [Pseudomonadota bacterium]